MKIRKERQRMLWRTVDWVEDGVRKIFIEVIFKHVLEHATLISGRKTLQAEKKAGTCLAYMKNSTEACAAPAEWTMREQETRWEQYGQGNWAGGDSVRCYRFCKDLAFPLSEARNHWRILSRRVTWSDLKTLKVTQNRVRQTTGPVSYLFW